MEETIKIHCKNTGSELHVKPGTTLSEVLSMLALKSKSETPFLAAYVNNRLKELYYQIFNPVSLRFVDITHFEGMRVYQRTLFFVMQKAVRDLFPGQRLHIKHSVAKGFYCEIEGMEEVSLDQIKAIFRLFVKNCFRKRRFSCTPSWECRIRLRCLRPVRISMLPFI